MNENELSKVIIDLSIKIHRKLGPGLLESVYETVLAYELQKAGIKFERQKPIQVVYEEVVIDDGYRADLIVEDKVIIELKSVSRLENIHAKQLLSYLRLSGKKLGLLINFNEALLKNGIKRIANELDEL